MDKISHFEIPVDNMERAKKFYKDNFDWGITAVPEMNYTMIHTGPTDEEGMTQEKGFINGGMLKRNEVVKAPVVTIVVSNMDTALKKIEKSGGKIVEPKKRIGDMGFTAYIKDTEDNTIGLFQSLKQ